MESVTFFLLPQGTIPVCLLQSILGVTVESVQGNGVSGVVQDIGSFGIMARPLEFLSTVKLKDASIRSAKETP